MWRAIPLEIETYIKGDDRILVKVNQEKHRNKTPLEQWLEDKDAVPTYGKDIGEFFTRFSTLHDHFTAYCKKNNYFIYNKNKMGRELAKLGIKKEIRGHDNIVFYDVEVCAITDLQALKLESGDVSL